VGKIKKAARLGGEMVGAEDFCPCLGRQREKKKQEKAKTDHQ